MESLIKALGRPPFPWQLRLAEQLLAGSVPASLDIPTGLGKTAVIALWLAARAQGAELPRRLVYVVDRRAVVDQATTEAIELRARVKENSELGEALGLGDRPLPISTLRGQFLDNREWLADPASPAIVVGTVDMIGSRLLFEGYGCSRKMRPFHAGLLGQDTLFVLDESHLVPPFEHLLREAVEPNSTLRPGVSEGGCALPPSRLLCLSATGGSDVGPEQSILRLDESDRAHPIVARRLGAPKALRLHDLPEEGELEDALAQSALECAGTASRRVLVYCNSRARAQKVAQQLANECGDPERVELIVGARRVFERQGAFHKMRELGFLPEHECLEAFESLSTFVVATAAGEVGIDLDASDMVADLVPWERMVQRLGRVNRRGDGAARIEVWVEPRPEGDGPEPGRSRNAAGGDLQSGYSLAGTCSASCRPPKAPAMPALARWERSRAKTASA